MCRRSDTICLVKPPVRQHDTAIGLAERLKGLADPLRRPGRRHPFVSVVLIAASTVLAGARSYAAIGQWAASAPQHTLARLGAQAVGVLGVRVAPSRATIRRVLTLACPGGLAELTSSDPAGAQTLAVDGGYFRMQPSVRMERKKSDWIAGCPPRHSSADHWIAFPSSTPCKE